MQLRPLAIIGVACSTLMVSTGALADRPVKSPREFTVYFDYEQAGLSQGLVTVRAAVDYGGPDARYEVVGHSVEDERAEFAGHRSNAVGIALRTMGIPSTKVSEASDPHQARRIHNTERQATIKVSP